MMRLRGRYSTFGKVEAKTEEQARALKGLARAEWAMELQCFDREIIDRAISDSRLNWPTWAPTLNEFANYCHTLKRDQASSEEVARQKALPRKVWTDEEIEAKRAAMRRALRGEAP